MRIESKGIFSRLEMKWNEINIKKVCMWVNGVYIYEKNVLKRVFFCLNKVLLTLKSIYNYLEIFDQISFKKQKNH